MEYTGTGLWNWLGSPDSRQGEEAQPRPLFEDRTVAEGTEVDLWTELLDGEEAVQAVQDLVETGNRLVEQRVDNPLILYTLTEREMIGYLFDDEKAMLMRVSHYIFAALGGLNEIVEIGSMWRQICSFPHDYGLSHTWPEIHNISIELQIEEEEEQRWAGSSTSSDWHGIRGFWIDSDGHWHSDTEDAIVSDW